MHNKRLHNRPGYAGAFSYVCGNRSLSPFQSLSQLPARRVKRPVINDDDFFDKFDFEDAFFAGCVFGFIEEDEEDEKKQGKLEEQEQLETEQDLFSENEYDEISRE